MKNALKLKLSSAIALAAVAANLNLYAGSLLSTTTHNGHTYELWEDAGIAWDNARLAAIASGGYLAVLNDATETSTVYGAFVGTGFFQAVESQTSQAWLGGYTTDPGFSTTDPNAWAWLTGESWSAFAAGNFGGGEPNGDSSGLAVNRFGTSHWNDEGGFVGGYIVEKNSVPEAGASFLLLSGALGCLSLFRRKLQVQ